EGYIDASWISNTEDNSSTSSWVFLLGSVAISWASKKQTCITGSTMESGFVALVVAGKEAEWLRNLIFEIPLWYSAFGRHLEEIHVTWAHLEKKQTRLRTYTNIPQEFQKLEMTSQITRDAVTTHTKTASQDLKTVSECTTQPII
ncbi:hypothetical protein Tco_1100491, partial [Tanacetum coccineum]